MIVEKLRCPRSRRLSRARICGCMTVLLRDPQGRGRGHRCAQLEQVSAFHAYVHDNAADLQRRTCAWRFVRSIANNRAPGAAGPDTTPRLDPVLGQEKEMDLSLVETQQRVFWFLIGGFTAAFSCRVQL